MFPILLPYIWNYKATCIYIQEFKNESDGSVETISGRGGASLIASKNEDKLFLVAGFAGTECAGDTDP